MSIRMGHFVAGALIAMSLLWMPRGLADPDGAQDRSHPQHRERATGLVKEVRQATRRFRDVEVAIAEGYGLLLGCVAGHHGAMGIHFVNGALIGDGVVDPLQPEALIYEPKANGRLKLVAVEFVAIKGAWDAANGTMSAPVLRGQLFHFAGSPNRYGLPEFYELHVWAFKRNPHGTFADFNPRVSCDQYDPPLM